MDRDAIPLHTVETEQASALLSRSDSLEHLVKPGPFYRSTDIGYKFERYYARGVIGTVAPVIITTYFLLTWVFYLGLSEPPNGILFGRGGGQLVLYSWFILGVIGLDIGEYGLIGAEASMLMDAFWAVPNAWHIMMHGEHTWSGLEGWISATKSLFGKERKHTKPHKLWWVLAFPTICFFIALPLTGLTMEMSDGFGASSSIPYVAGYRYETFNQRSDQQTIDAAQNAWNLAVPPRIPGFGMLYTNASKSSKLREDLGLNGYPNILPSDNGVDEIFLVAQAETPISGKSWGLIVRYNCTIVQRLEDFTILNQRKPNMATNATFQNGYMVGDHQIIVYNHTVWGQGNLDVNYLSAMEIGFSDEVYGGNFFASQNATNCYFNKSEGATVGYPGLEHDNVFEVAYWQYAVNDNGLVNPPLPPSMYNFTINNTIPELKGAYSVPNSHGNGSIAMDAIGVRCMSSSAVGTAELDAQTSTYKNFERSDTIITENVFQYASRLSLAIRNLIVLKNSDYNLFYSGLFTSVEVLPSFLTSKSGDSVVFLTVRLTLLQANELRRSLLRAYSTYATQLIYNRGQGYAFANVGSQLKFRNDNTTTPYTPTRILGRGPIPPIFPAVFLILWAVSSFCISLRYGFARRWAESLDSYSLFKFGVDLSGQVEGNSVSGVKDLGDHHEFRNLPGLIGDSKPAFDPGHVSLVPSIQASKSKRYS